MPKDRGDEQVGKGEQVRIKAELLDEVLKEYRGPEDFEEIFKQFKKAVLERALGAELTQHLGLRQRRGQAGASKQPPKQHR
jgi:hypothetical protein